MLRPLPGQRPPHSHVIGQVVLLQRVGLEPVGCGIEVITADATDEALGLWMMADIRVEAQWALQGPIIPLGRPQT